MEKLIHLILLSGLVSIPGSLEENVALIGTAIQSFTHYPWVASNAIDGKRYGSGTAAYCSITGTNYNPWWRLDLQNTYEIRTVIITARSDCCLDETNGAEIRIGNSLENNGNNNPRCAVTSGFLLRQTISYSCNGMKGRYVNVVKTGFGIVSLCEVEVYETENVALRGTAIQSSTYGIYWVASNAIDGKLYGSDGGSSCSITEYLSNSWWRLNLQNTYEITTVIITARPDCCFDDTNGAEIRIGNSLENNGNNNPRCAVTSGYLPRQTISYSCNGMKGRYVNVVKTGLTSCLSLCEVEIHVKYHRRKTFLRLKLSSSVDAAAVSDKILKQFQSILGFHISDFNVSWTKRPQQELKHKQNTGPCSKSLV